MLLALLCVGCFFIRLGAIGLFDFNEGFYVQAAREMALRHDYITPRVNGLFFFDKPPLALWLDSIMFNLFGATPLTARLPVAAAATALVFVTYALGTRLLNRATALLACSMLALNPLVFGTERQMTMDLHQSLWIAVALWCFAIAQASPNSRHNWPLNCGFWLACGIAFMAKSVPGLFPIPIAFVYLTLSARFNWRVLARQTWLTMPIPGVLLLAAVVLPWHLLAYRANGLVFYQQYWLLHHVKLATGSDFNHAQPVYYYVPALLAGLFPWSLLLCPALVWGIRTVRAGNRAPRKSDSENSRGMGANLTLPIVWGMLPLLAFTAMRSKLVSYLLPCYPAYALLAAAWVVHCIRTGTTRKIAVPVGIAAAVSALVSVGGYLVIAKMSADPLRSDMPPSALQWAPPAVAVCALGLAISAALFTLRRPRLGVWLMPAGPAAVGVAAILIGLPTIAAHATIPLQSLAAQLGELAVQGNRTAIFLGGPRHPSVFFYMPGAIFSAPIAPGLEHEVLLERSEADQIVQFLRRPGGAYVLTDVRRARELGRLVPNLAVYAHSHRWLILMQPAGSRLPAAHAT